MGYFSEAMITGAYVSVCKRYRYSLWRSWSVERKAKDCCFIMLNPSTADEQQDDPTVRRCIGFAQQWGCTGLIVVNLFALRSTNPAKLKAARDPVGPENDVVLLTTAHSASIVVCAWGNHGKLHGRDQRVITLLRDNEITAYALSITQRGQPQHPLFAPKNVKLKLFVNSTKRKLRK